MTDKKRPVEAPAINEEDLLSFLRTYYQKGAERALVEYVNKIISVALTSRDAEIERLRAELQELEDKYEALLFSRPD